MAKATMFDTTKGLRKALREGELKTNGTEYIELDDGLYIVDYHYTNRGKKIRLEDILICVPTNETRDGKPVLEAVECDIDPQTIYGVLADMFNYEK